MHADLFVFIQRITIKYMPTPPRPPLESINSYYLTIKSSLVLCPNAVEELMPHGLLNSDPLFWIKREEAIEKVVQDIVIALTKYT